MDGNPNNFMSDTFSLKDLTPVIDDPLDKSDGLLQNQTDKMKMDEALTPAQRLKAKMTMRKNKSRIAAGRKRAKNRFASPEKLKARAARQARNLVAKTILKGKSKTELSYAARTSLEKQLKKRKNQIDMLSRRLLPVVRKQELARHSSSSDK